MVTPSIVGNGDMEGHPDRHPDPGPGRQVDGTDPWT